MHQELLCKECVTRYPQAMVNGTATIGAGEDVVEASMKQLRCCMVMRTATVGAGEDVVEASGKMEVLDRMLGMLAERGHRVVLFSQLVQAMTCWKPAGRSRCWTCVCCDIQVRARAPRQELFRP